MEKIVLVLDGNDIRPPVLDFACYLARLTSSSLNAISVSWASVEPVPPANPHHNSHSNHHFDIADTATASAGIDAILNRYCAGRGIVFINKTLHGNAVKEIVQESRYADILLLDAQVSPDGLNQGMLSDFSKDVLQHAECPVLIAPAGFDGINEIVFAYDGSAASVFAIKQFTYLFPELTDKMLTILQVSDDSEKECSGREHVKDLLEKHFSSVRYEIIKGAAEKKLLDWLIGRKDALVVMGSYGGNSISRILHRSHAELIIRVAGLPVFITHR